MSSLLLKRMLSSPFSSLGPLVRPSRYILPSTSSWNDHHQSLGARHKKNILAADVIMSLHGFANVRCFCSEHKQEAVAKTAVPPATTETDASKGPKIGQQIVSPGSLLPISQNLSDLKGRLNEEWEKLHFKATLLQGREAPTIFQVLGVLGLMPLVLPCGYMLLNFAYSPFCGAAVIYYSACILSFLGGVRWGRNLEYIDDAQVYYSIIPPVVAWISLLLPLPLADFSLIMGHAQIAHYDITKPGYNQGFRGLRLMLSTMVIVIMSIQLLIRWFFPSSELRYTYARALPSSVASGPPSSKKHTAERIECNEETNDATATE